MATPELARTRVRVPMVVPPKALVLALLEDLRAEPRADAELVDQLHYRELTRVLGERGGWLYVVADDGYFGWLAAEQVEVMRGSHSGRRIAAAAARVHAACDRGSPVIGHLPVATRLTAQQAPGGEEGWVRVELGPGRGAIPRAIGYVSMEDVAELDDLPHRYPTAEDLVRTAAVFIGTPYLWGGTSALGLDCSGLVQQVYRLNGVGLPRDADQQALAGRDVTEPRTGDLIFFGSPRVTHVALYVGAGEVIHAPQRGGFVERKALADLGRERVSVRRYLMDEA